MRVRTRSIVERICAKVLLDIGELRVARHFREFEAEGRSDITLYHLETDVHILRLGRISREEYRKLTRRVNRMAAERELE